MTKKEYKAAYMDARKRAATINIDTMKQAHTLYVRAAEEAGKQLASSRALDVSIFTEARWREVSAQLQTTASTIQKRMEEMTIAGASGATKPFVDLNIKYTAQGLIGVKGITAESLNAAGVSINNNVIMSLINRQTTDGYSLSSRTWKLANNWMEDVRGVVTTGIALGRSPKNIARDLTAYTKDGKVALAKRYGPNVSTTAKEAANRLPKNIDYRALRLVRSELYASIQDAQVKAGEANPGATGKYNWVLNPARQHWNCECNENAEGGPYSVDKIPAYPHPNCMCSIEPELRDHDEFMKDLLDWKDGKPVGYLDDWYKDVYLPAEISTPHVTGIPAVRTDTPTGGATAPSTEVPMAPSQEPVSLDQYDSDFASVESKLKTAYSEWRPKTEQVDVNVIEDYTMDIYDPINQYLLKGESELEQYRKLTRDELEDTGLDRESMAATGIHGKNVVERVKNFVVAMDSALAKGKVPDNVITYRGMETIPKIVDDTMTFKNFMSTSIKAEVAEGFAEDGWFLKLFVPKGATGVYVEEFTANGGEYELLLPRNTTWDVIDRNDKLNILTLKLKEDK